MLDMTLRTCSDDEMTMLCHINQITLTAIDVNGLVFSRIISSATQNTSGSRGNSLERLSVFGKILTTKKSFWIGWANNWTSRVSKIGTRSEKTTSLPGIVMRR